MFPKFGQWKWAHKNRGLNGWAAIVAVAAVLMLSIAGSAGAIPATAQEGPQYSIGIAVATSANTDLLDQPASDGPVLAAVPVNTRGIVLGGPFNDGWYWLDTALGKGYIQAKNLVQVDANWKPIQLETPKPTNTPVPPATNTPVRAAATNTPARVQPTATVVAATAQPSTVAATAIAVTPSASGTPAGNSLLVPNQPGDYTNLWLAEMSSGGNVRVGPGLDQKILKSWWAGRRVILYQSVVDAKGSVWYRVSDPPEAPMWVNATLVRKVAPIIYEGAKYKGRWVNVSISQQVVTAYQDGTPVKVTLASTGKAPNLTDLGVWKIYWRLPSQEMKGGNKASGDYYDLKDVPFPQYFHISGEALHGTYWHDDFGHPHSHGCVNLSTPISEWFYGWDQIGTIVYVHN